MDYEKAYKAVLKTAKQWIKDGCTDKEKICLECVFPELQESKDEKTRKQLIDICNEWLGGGFNARPCLDDVRWLKNLLEKQKEPKHAPDDLQKSFEAGQTSIVDNPEQYGLCKKAEWSEKDEAMRDNILRLLSCFVGTSERDSNPSLSTSYQAYQREIDWLKSLRPSWKPSEEQMSALLWCIAHLGGADRRVLAELYEHLKMYCK